MRNSSAKASAAPISDRPRSPHWPSIAAAIASNTAVAAVKGADYSKATPELQKLASNVKLTDEQKKAINDVLAKIQQALTDAGTKAAGDASKALGDVQKSLGK